MVSALSYHHRCWTGIHYHLLFPSIMRHLKKTHLTLDLAVIGSGYKAHCHDGMEALVGYFRRKGWKLDGSRSAFASTWAASTST